MVDGRRGQACASRMRFWGDIVFFCSLGFGEVYVPRASPIEPILALFGAGVRNAVRGVVSDFWTAVRVGASEVCLVGVQSA